MKLTDAQHEWLKAHCADPALPMLIAFRARFGLTLAESSRLLRLHLERMAG